MSVQFPVEGGVFRGKAIEKFPPAPTPETDAATCDFAPTADPRYEGPVEWVPSSFARELERQRDKMDLALKRARADLDDALIGLDTSLGYNPNIEQIRSQIRSIDEARKKSIP